jgi:FkbM family methyltransferase
MRGSLQGTKWNVRSGGKLMRVLLGTYEKEQTLAFEQLVKPGAVMFDVGAHVGYYTLLSSKLVGDQGKVVAFEAMPRNAAYLRQHVSRNRCANVEVIEGAVSKGPGTARFARGTGTGTGKLSDGGPIEVRTMSLDDVAAERGLSPTFIKIDVEGAEELVLDGAARVLRESRPVIFLSTHGPDLHARCCKRLSALGYSLAPLVGSSLDLATEVLATPQRG